MIRRLRFCAKDFIPFVDLMRESWNQPYAKPDSMRDAVFDSGIVQALEDLMRSPDNIVNGYFVDDDLAAAFVHIRLDDGSLDIHINTGPGYRGRGLTRDMLRANIAALPNGTRVVATVPSCNVTTEALFLGLGFKSSESPKTWTHEGIDYKCHVFNSTKTEV